MTSLSRWVKASDPQCAGLLKRAPIPGRGGGHGMLARKRIEKGEKLVSVPRKLWMTSETAKESPICGQLLQTHKTIDDWTNEHPLAWKEEKEWLRGSPMAAKLAKRQAQVTSDTARLLEIGAGSLPCPTGSTDVLVSVENMTWAAATLLSRSFNLEMAPPKAPSDNSAEVPDVDKNGKLRVPSDDELFGANILALVPWADSINHCSSAGERSMLQYDVTRDAAVLFAHKAYDPGEEVFDSYGIHLTPSDLLLDYGFVDPKNKIAAITVPAESIIAKSEPAPLNQALLKGVSQTFSGTPEMRLTDTGIDDTLLSFVRCAVAAETQLLAAGWSTSWVQGQPGGSDDLPLDVMAKLVTPVDFNTEARVLETLLTWCEQQLKDYPTAMQNDREELNNPKTTWLRAQTLRALIAEKDAVVGMQTELRDRMQQLKEGCPLETLYS